MNRAYHHFCVGVAYALMVIMTVGACTRSLPDHFQVATNDAQPAIRVQGLQTDRIWPLIFSHGQKSASIPMLERWMRVEQEITGHSLIAGNQVELLIDGPMTFDAMFAAIRQARHHIHLETFIFDDESISRKLTRLLIERHRAGVTVRMVIDGFGALESDESVLNPLREAGIQVYIYHPIRPTEMLRFWRINTRHHRKMLIVDGRIGFLGGINISKVYASSSLGASIYQKDNREGWRDTHLRVEGPIVAQMQSLFVAFWTGLHGGEPLSGTDYFPSLPNQGNMLVRLVSSMAEDDAHEVYRLYLAALNFARQTIWITQGYFSPNRAFIEALKAAAHRGVDVRLLLPGLTDSWITISSSRWHYEELLEAGVRIFERRDVLQHAKTAVIDGVWSTVGSTNLDYRSFLHANEANLVIWGQEFADRMQDQFLLDQQKNTEITLSQWRNRPFQRRLWETMANLFDYWL
ncbi:MAG: phospholipase D-like domain-containing protein [Desulfosarcina sp.]